MRPPFLITIAASGFVLALSCAPAHGLGIAIMNQSPEGYGRGNAYSATADSPSAIFYNPAGITQLPGTSVELGYYGTVYDSNVRPAIGGNYDSSNKFEGVPDFYATFAVPDTRFSFGLGVYSPFGLGTAYPDNTPFRSLATSATLMYITLNPVVAYKVTKTFSLAAGPTINYANADFRRGILTPGDEFRFGGDGFACGFSLGAMWQPTEQHSFGVTSRSATHMDLYGHVDTTSLTTFLFPSSRERATGNIDFPQQIIGAYSFRPTPQWNLEVDVNWTDWQQDKGITVREANGTNVLDVFNWHSEFTISAGVTRTFDNGLSLSAGFFYCPGATPDAYYTPSVPDTDLYAFTWGVDYRFNKNWKVGLSYGVALGENHTVTGSASTLAGQNADGKYGFNGQAFTVGVTYSF